MNPSRRLMKILLILMLTPMLGFGAALAWNAWNMVPADTAAAIFTSWEALLSLAFAVLACIAIASFLADYINDQLAFLTNISDAMTRGQNMLHIHERELSEEFHPLYDALKAHAHFHDDITARMKEMVKSFSGQPFSVRSEDDELIKTFNTLLRYTNNLQEILTAVNEHNFASITASNDFHSNPTFPLYVMLRELTDLTAHARDSADQIVKVGARASSMTNQIAQDAKLSSKHVQEIAQTISFVGTTLRNISNDLHAHVVHVDDTASTIETTSRAVEHLAQSIEEMKSVIAEHPFGVIDSGHAVQVLECLDDATRQLEEDAAACKNSVQETLNDAQHGILTTQEAMDSMNAIADAVQEFFAIVKRLGERSEEVGETLEVIRDIADHTTLLAINAAIISAHAGEHGRDFAVIANEIGKFAERTQDSAAEIEELLQTISREFVNATSAMNRLSKAIDDGMARSDKTGEAFILLRNKLLSLSDLIIRITETSGIHKQENLRIREILGEVEFALHDKQDRIASMVWQLMQVVVQMRTINATHTENQRHVLDTTQHLNSVSQDIERIAQHHAQKTQDMLKSIEYIEKLAHRTNIVAEKAAQLSQELFDVGRNLVFTMGEFTMPSATSEFRAPENGRPIIGFIKRGVDQFFRSIGEGIREEAERQGFDMFEIDSRYDTIAQIEQVNWLLKLPMLRGVILCPTDPHIALKLVQKGFAAGIPFVAADETIATTFSIRSGNREGGRQAAEILMMHLPPRTTVGIVVDRAVESMVRRTLGFRQRAEQYPFDLVEIVCDVIRFDKLKQAISSGIQQNPGMQGLFLSNELVTTAYLNALHENLLPSHTLLAVGYDRTPLSEQALRNGELVGAIFQYPVEIGRQAFRQLHKLITQQIRIDEQEERSIYIPTLPVTKDNLDMALLPTEPQPS